jgi:hypothetical protein
MVLCDLKDKEMPERLIFVSCGQLTDEERRLGQKLRTEIDGTEGYSAYFADAVQSLRGLGEHILDAIRRCTAAVVVMHPRGHIRTDENVDLGVRSSVWINQEVAILAYRRYFEDTEIPILAFKHSSIKLEGAMSAFILNPYPLNSDDQVIEETRAWLQGAARVGREAMADVFGRKWEEVTPEGRELLKALVAEGGLNVKDTSVCRRLVSYGVEGNRAWSLLREQRLALSPINLVRLIPNIYDGDEMSLHPTWEWYVRHEVAKLA